MAKEINFKEARSGMISGINKVSDAIKVTLGPKGGCVAIQGGFGTPDITRDGATVAKSIELSDPIENMGAQLVKKAAQSTEEQAGDSTSTTSILIQEMVLKGQELIKSSTNLNKVKAGMSAAEKFVASYIKEAAIEVNGDLEKIRKVATVSANNDPSVGDLIVECMGEVGIDGVITADITSGLETTIDVVTGMRVDRGWSSPGFVTDQASGKCVMESPVILVAGEKISSVNQILPIIEVVVKDIKQPLLIFCDDMDENVLATLVMNSLSGALRSCVVKGIDFGDARKNLMEDIATITGAKHICPEYGTKLSDATVEVLGMAKKVEVSKDSCIIYEGSGDKDKITERLEIIKSRLENPDLTDYEKSKFLKRVSGLSGGIGIIKAGGASDVEKQNKKATIEDAILASKSAIAEGVVPGGGSIFLGASQEGKEEFPELYKDKGTDFLLGGQIVFEALPRIMKTIAENSGIQGDVLVYKVQENLEGIKNFGYNAATEEFGDLLEMGVLDSVKALRVSLENAVSAAGMCLLTKCTITDEPKKEEK
jgi:chaperonin GroEL